MRDSARVHIEPASNASLSKPSFPEITYSTFKQIACERKDFKSTPIVLLWFQPGLGHWIPELHSEDSPDRRNNLVQQLEHLARRTATREQLDSSKVLTGSLPGSPLAGCHVIFLSSSLLRKWYYITSCSPRTNLWLTFLCYTCQQVCIR